MGGRQRGNLLFGKKKPFYYPRLKFLGWAIFSKGNFSLKKIFPKKQTFAGKPPPPNPFFLSKGALKKIKSFFSFSLLKIPPCYLKKPSFFYPNPPFFFFQNFIFFFPMGGAKNPPIFFSLGGAPMIFPPGF